MGTDADHERRVTLLAVDDPPDLPVRPAVAVTDDRATADGPARLEAAVTSESGDPVRVGEARAVCFAHATDETARLVLRPTDDGWPERYAVTAGTWRERSGVALTMEHQTLSLSPGETQHRPLALHGLHGDSGPLPTGEFRFESRLAVTKGTFPATTGREARTATWGFRLGVSRPDDR